MSEPYSYKALIEGIADDAPCACDGGCDWHGPYSDLSEIDTCSLTPGDPSPAGRCPECDTLAYVVKPVANPPAEPDTQQAKDNAFDDGVKRTLEAYNRTCGGDPDPDVMYTMCELFKSAALREIMEGWVKDTTS